MIKSYQEWLANNKAKIDSLEEYKHIKNMYPIYKNHYHSYLEDIGTKILEGN